MSKIEIKESTVLKPTIERHGNILVIEDDTATADAIGSFLRSEGFSVRCVSTRADAVPLLNSVLYDVIIMDFMMPGMSAADFMVEARRRGPTSRFVLMTASQLASHQSAKLGIGHWLSKPFELDELLKTIEKCCS